MTAQQDDLGRRRGVWIAEEDVEAHIANGWTIADGTPHRGAVLMAPPQAQEDIAA